MPQGEVYAVTVRADNVAGPGNWTEPVQSPLVLGLPGVPQAPVLTASLLGGDGVLTVAWGPPSDTGMLSSPQNAQNIHFACWLAVTWLTCAWHHLSRRGGRDPGEDHRVRRRGQRGRGGARDGQCDGG